MTPLVSILIPAYNAERYLAETVRSALAQSWGRKEIIVIDDGSTDQTPRVAAGFASRWVKVVRQENQGAAAARNHALRIAQGDYIQWLDSDDLLSVDKVSHQVHLLRGLGDPRVLGSCEWGYFRTRPRAARFSPGPLGTDLDPVEWMLRKWETNSHMQTATWLTPRVVSDAAGPWNATLSTDDDGEYFSRVLAQSSCVRFAPRARVYYRISPRTRLSYIGGSSRKLDSMYKGMRLQIDLLRSLQDDARARDACVTYIETWLPEFDGHRPDLVQALADLAREWGRHVRVPSISWKYRWIAVLWGPERARSSQIAYNQLKAWCLRQADLALAKAARPYDPASL